MYWKALDKIDSSAYKGIAILMIVSHNFMHTFPVPKENEFDFNPGRFIDLVTILLSEPENGIRASLSFFGHFGVQIFVFLSAYGLTKKYNYCKISYWPFIFERILRIYPAFILAIIAWAIISGGGADYGILGPLKVLYWDIENIILKITLLSNFIPGHSLSPVGPWWFIPFIFQFYFLFPFLLHLHSRLGESVLLLVSVFGLLCSMLTQGNIGGLNIYFTILGHLPEFCLGIYLAKRDHVELKVSMSFLMPIFLIFLLGNIYPIFWYANHISFLVLLLALFSVLIKIIKNSTLLKEFFCFFGGISMPLFLVNGFLREPFSTWAISYNNWLLTIALCLLSMACSVLVSLVLAKIELRIMSRRNESLRDY